MSVEIMFRVFAHSQSKGTARLVLLAIADHCNHSGVCWPSIRRIAQYCNSDRRSVQRSISQLVNLGELERLEMGHGRSATRYKVKLRGGKYDRGGESVTSEAVNMTPLRRSKCHPNHNRTIIEPSLKNIGHFDEFWTQYPKKVAKGGARKAYEKALKLTTHEDIMAGLARYNPNPQYICNPTTWLNQERWNDEPSSIKPDSFASDQSRSDGNRHAEAYERFMARRATDQ